MNQYCNEHITFNEIEVLEHLCFTNIRKYESKKLNSFFCGKLLRKAPKMKKPTGWWAFQQGSFQSWLRLTVWYYCLMILMVSNFPSPASKRSKYIPAFSPSRLISVCTAPF